MVTRRHWPSGSENGIGGSITLVLVIVLLWAPWWFAASNLDQASFPITIQFSGSWWCIADLAVQCRIEALGNKRFPNIESGLRTTPDDLSNLVVRFISMEQDIGMLDCGGRGFTRRTRRSRNDRWSSVR